MAITQGRIQSADLDGTSVQTVKEITAVPYNIAVGTDKSGKRWVYWTNSNKKIQRINVEGKDFRGGNFIKRLNTPKHIAFDMEKHRLYWTEMGADDIWRIYSTYPAHVDKGTAMVRPLGKEDLGQVKGIAV